MKRRITLYIGDERADLQEDALILYNYTLTDLQKPTAVKNSYSKQLTLPGSPANDRIFGHYFRTDRVNSGSGGTGTAFNAKNRTPFTIYADTGEVLQAGYMKLDEVKREGRGHSYAVTLYGGLGGFFYGLMFNADGSKRTLADMEYYYWIPSYYAGPLDLTRTVEAATISEAWDYIGMYAPPSEKLTYKVLNWAPAYNGIPEEFDAKKVIVYPGTTACYHIPSELEDEDGNFYYPYQGGGMVEMTKAMTEWKMRDLRSYLQRPILSVKALLDSISQPQNNGGYELEWKTRPPQERDLWLTLKRPVDIDYNAEAETVAVDETSTAMALPAVQSRAYAFTVDAATKGVDFALTLTPKFVPSPASASNTLYCAWDRLKRDGSGMETVAAACLVQVVAYDSSDNVKYASPVYEFSNATPRKTLADLFTEVEAGVTNLTGGGIYPFVNLASVGFARNGGTFDKDAGSGEYLWSDPVALSFHAERVARVRVFYGWYADETQADHDTPCGLNVSTSRNVFEGGISGAYNARLQGTATIAGGPSRSGITYTQADLLRTDHSPADYLLSLAKMFGWLFTCDEKEKRITVWDRNAFFSTGEGVEDLTPRVDRGSEVSIIPLYAGSRIYGLNPAAIGGKADEYKAKFGRVYGGFRVNTGYEFNDTEVNLMEGTVLRTAVPWLDRGKDYTLPVLNNDPHLNFEQDGFKLTYGDKISGTFTKEISPILPTAWDSYGALPFSDAVDKFQFQDGDEKPVGGEDCLLYFAGASPSALAGREYELTDDNDLMYYLNGDKPCWIAAWDDNVPGVYEVRDSVPTFRPFMTNYDGEQVTPWLCFGIPAELYDPLIQTWDEDGTLYGWYWAEYLRDLLDEDTKVMRCKVDLSGLRVGAELLRRFFWYEGSVWALNKITNHSITTRDLTECEFIQVRDMERYTNGQKQ